MKNPWLRPAPDYYPVDVVMDVTVEDRIRTLRGFDAAKLREVIAYPGTQKTVKKAAERRLRGLVAAKLKAKTDE